MAVDPTKPVRTVGEKLPVRLLCTDAKLYRRRGDEWVGLVLLPSGEESIRYWGPDGKFAGDSKFDLENVPQTKVGWINISPPWGKPSRGFSAVASDVYESRELADKCAGPDRLTCVRVEWEE